jgi:hypothetical protein
VVVRATSRRRAVPISAWVRTGAGLEAAVVLPVEMLGSPREARLAICHELQHHRQGDTAWAYGLEVIACLFWWNPAAGLAARALSRLQEFSCDDALIGRRGVSPQEYGRCLLRAAELAVGSPALRYGAAAAAGGSSGTLLKRRIEMLFTQKSRNPLGTAALVATGALALAAMGSAAFAARSAIQDHSLTLAELKARVVPSDGDFPLVINEKVLRELNRYAGTEEGREHLHAIFARMPQYQPMIEKKFQERGVAKDLEILPVIESGFTNYFGHLQSGAGLWGFIPSTARRYDLRVDPLGEPGRVDDRLNEEKETVAAARYLRDVYNLFGDWRLAVMAYSEGEHKLSELIVKLGTRDPWEIEEQAESPDRYLAQVTAVLLIYKNPGLLD